MFHVKHGMVNMYTFEEIWINDVEEYVSELEY
jgi:hypothetical protein